MPPTTHLLYLHGFRSSPQSNKARLMAAEVASAFPQVTWWCPQLPPSPRAAAELIQHGTQHWPRESMAVVGSSLGGFYATWVAQWAACKAVLLNPAVDPARDLGKYIGELASWHNPAERFLFKAEYIDELRALDIREAQQSLDSPGLKTVPPCDPGLVYAVIAKGDEVLDWREMVARYPVAQVQLLEGGDHAISDFEDHLSGIFAFLSLSR